MITGVVWHWWLGFFLAITAVISVLAVGVGYLVKVVDPRIRLEDRERRQRLALGPGDQRAMHEPGARPAALGRGRTELELQR